MHMNGAWKIVSTVEVWTQDLTVLSQPASQLLTFNSIDSNQEPKDKMFQIKFHIRQIGIVFF